MALERFLTKKLNNAEESNWLLQNQEDGDSQMDGEKGTPSKRVRPAKWYGNILPFYFYVMQKFII